MPLANVRMTARDMPGIWGLSDVIFTRLVWFKTIICKVVIVVIIYPDADGLNHVFLLFPLLSFHFQRLRRFVDLTTHTETHLGWAS